MHYSVITEIHTEAEFIFKKKLKEKIELYWKTFKFLESRYFLGQVLNI